MVTLAGKSPYALYLGINTHMTPWKYNNTIISKHSVSVSTSVLAARWKNF